jgi:hypothetical protein
LSREQDRQLQEARKEWDHARRQFAALTSSTHANLEEALRQNDLAEKYQSQVDALNKLKVTSKPQEMENLQFQGERQIFLCKSHRNHPDARDPKKFYKVILSENVTKNESLTALLEEFPGKGPEHFDFRFDEKRLLHWKVNFAVERGRRQTLDKSLKSSFGANIQLDDN